MDLCTKTKNVKIGNHVKLERGKTGVVNKLGKYEDDISIEFSYPQTPFPHSKIAERSANGNDGKRFPNHNRTSKGRIANILPEFSDLQEGHLEQQLATLKFQMANRKRSCAYSARAKEQRNGEAFDAQQLAKCDRKRLLRQHMTENMHQDQLLSRPASANSQSPCAAAGATPKQHQKRSPQSTASSTSVCPALQEHVKASYASRKTISGLSLLCSQFRNC